MESLRNICKIRRASECKQFLVIISSCYNGRFCFLALFVPRALAFLSPPLCPTGSLLMTRFLAVVTDNLGVGVQGLIISFRSVGLGLPLSLGMSSQCLVRALGPFVVYDTVLCFLHEERYEVVGLHFLGRSSSQGVGFLSRGNRLKHRAIRFR